MQTSPSKFNAVLWLGALPAILFSLLTLGQGIVFLLRGQESKSYADLGGAFAAFFAVLVIPYGLLTLIASLTTRFKHPVIHWTGAVLCFLLGSVACLLLGGLGGSFLQYSPATGLLTALAGLLGGGSLLLAAVTGPLAWKKNNA
ncbi:MAG: hypothetical protein HY869_00355 [Chloroflexi bacterium]|nr:hypothetical protein [Chloroflexota bacterium]